MFAFSTEPLLLNRITDPAFVQSGSEHIRKLKLSLLFIYSSMELPVSATNVVKVFPRFRIKTIQGEIRD